MHVITSRAILPVPQGGDCIMEKNEHISGTVIDMDPIRMMASIFVDDDLIVDLPVDHRCEVGEEIELGRDC